MSVESNVKNVRERIAEVARKSGRKPSEVTLIAVSKFVEAERIVEAYEAGVRHFGENRMQELTQKTKLLEEYHIQWHFIGQLQTNKAKYLDARVCMVQSVDRPELIVKLNDAMARRGVKMPALIQVNIGDEPQKGGIKVDDAIGVIERFQDYPNLEVRGLMCVPPNMGSVNARYYFKKMRDCFERVRDKGFSHAEMQVLSMGMSGDFEAAIEEGSTMVRVGSAIFGERY